MNFLSGRIEGVSDAGTQLRLFDGELVMVPRRAEAVQAGEDVSVGLRPQHMRVAQDGENGVP